MDDGYLMRIFASECSEHRHPKTRTELVHLESFHNYQMHTHHCSSPRPSNLTRRLNDSKLSRITMDAIIRNVPSATRKVIPMTNVTRNIQS
jgi:hypothetical protein